MSESESRPADGARFVRGAGLVASARRSGDGAQGQYEYCLGNAHGDTVQTVGMDAMGTGVDIVQEYLLCPAKRIYGRYGNVASRTDGKFLKAEAA